MNNSNLLTKNELNDYKKLLLKKYRKEKREFIIEGKHLIEEAIKHKNLLKKIITSDYSFEIVNKNIDLKYTSYKNICTLSTTKNPQPYIGICNFLELKNIEKEKILVLNKINDPGNLGTIIRTANSFNIKNIIVEGVDIYNPKVIRATQGAIFNMNIFNVNDLKKEILALKKQNYKIVGSLLDKNSIDYRNLKLDKERFVLILGNEANGIEKNIIELLDYKVYIPIEFDSLNVAIAAAILMAKYYDK